MNEIRVLDCTLRDGGYCNQWDFGYENIKKIVLGLINANIDIIECGFLTDKEEYSQNKSKFSDLNQVESLLPANRAGKMFVVMMNDNQYDLNNLPVYNGKSIDGIRVAFHKDNLQRALNQCQIIKKKGYKVFVQAMVSLNYKDDEFIQLIQKVNELQPYAFYIVDSFGMMKEKDLLRLFYIVEHNLDENIWIGFHSHNNLQLAYSNAQCLVNRPNNRKLIVDSSIYGMGRGAGNLNTELFVDFLNENRGSGYKIKPLLNVIDEILNDFYQRNYWGYSLPNYLSAVHNAHPNYAGYLDDKKTLTVEDMNEIFATMELTKKNSFDKSYIEKLYFQYMDRNAGQRNYKSELKKVFAGKEVLLIAPGKSSTVDRELIEEYLRKKDVLSMSINFNYSYINTSYIFLSNLRRYRELSECYLKKCIVTSNLPVEDAYFRIDYQELLNKEEAVCDNAGLMAIKFLMLCEASEVILAGFDGYSHDYFENYGSDDLAFFTTDRMLDKMNVGMKNVLKEYGKSIKLKFLTKSKLIDM